MLHISLHRHILPWLQRQASLWPLALGSALGLGIGAGALWGIGGFLGAGVCLIGLGTVCWFARDAEPVLVGVDTVPTLQELLSDTASKPAPEPEPLLVEPLDMVELSEGTFWMGSPDTDIEAYGIEKPHKVTVSAFAISRYPSPGSCTGKYAGRRLRHGSETAMMIACQQTV